ncbi:MAG: anti-sigma factor antagonist [Firmicutes bacterium]|nr:anti-sigma factor antagonist [Bacillota bacterium]
MQSKRGGASLLSAETVNQALIVTLEGELDLHTAPPFKQCIDSHLAKNLALKDLVLKMDKINFIDSSGLGVILGRYKLIQKRGGKLIFVACNPQVHRILKLSGMQKIAYFADSVKEALSL